MTNVSAAATVCVVRDGSDGLEVLLAQRGMTAPFMPGAYVFPGGKIDEGDRRFADPAKAAGSGNGQAAVTVPFSATPDEPESQTGVFDIVMG